MMQADRLTDGLRVECERCGGDVVLTQRIADLAIDGNMQLRVRGWEGWCDCGASLYFSACWPHASHEARHSPRCNG